MYDSPQRPKRSWPKKFRDAFDGLYHGIAGQSSFAVHFVFATAVIGVGTVLRPSLVEWCILLFSITLVMAAEMFNSALGHLSRAVTKQEDPHVQIALNVGSAAVLVAAAGAAAVGAVVLLFRLGLVLRWW